MSPNTWSSYLKRKNLQNKSKAVILAIREMEIKTSMRYH
jgi:hypothetical protein